MVMRTARTGAARRAGMRRAAGRTSAWPKKKDMAAMRRAMDLRQRWGARRAGPGGGPGRRAGAQEAEVGGGAEEPDGGEQRERERQDAGGLAAGGDDADAEAEARDA